MYFQPYGDDQQLNLNWIINEIINLHKQLDPDYETPSFTQVYPYSNLNRLNLDWVLSELKALKELAPEPSPELDIQAVAVALVALPFDSNTSYQMYDFISKDGEIWRATETISAGGVWDETKWFKTKIGTDLAVLERWINAINNSLTSLQNTVANLSSIDISDDSDAGGATVKASLNLLKGSLNSINFANPTVITASGEDLNTYTTGGVWYFTDAAAPTNKPSGAGNYGFFVVMNGGTNSRLLQLWIDSSTSKNNIYFRSNDTSSIAWGAWKRVVRDDELTTTTIQASNIRENANIVIKNSGKTVVVSVSNGDNAIAHQTASSSWQILGYVPAGYRPSAAIFAVCFLRNVSTPTQLVFSYGRVATDGAIQIWNSAREGIVNMALTIIYLLD